MFYIDYAVQRNSSCVNVHINCYTCMCAGFSLYVQSQSACLARHGWWLIVEDSPTSWMRGQVGNFICLVYSIWIPPLLLFLVGLFYSMNLVTVPLSCSSIYITGFSHCLKLSVKLCLYPISHVSCCAVRVCCGAVCA